MVDPLRWCSACLWAKKLHQIEWSLKGEVSFALLEPLRSCSVTGAAVHRQGIPIAPEMIQLSLSDRGVCVRVSRLGLAQRSGKKWSNFQFHECQQKGIYRIQFELKNPMVNFVMRRSEHVQICLWMITTFPWYLWPVYTEERNVVLVSLNLICSVTYSLKKKQAKRFFYLSYSFVLFQNYENLR